MNIVKQASGTYHVGGDTVTVSQSNHKYMLLQVTVVCSIPVQYISICYSVFVLIPDLEP